MKSILYKIFFGYLLLIVLIAVFISIYSFNIIKENRIQEIESELKNQTELIKQIYFDYSIFNSPPKLDSLVKVLGKKIDKRITILLASGMVIADTEGDPSKMANHLDRPEILSALQTGYGQNQRFSETLNKEMLYVATPVYKNNYLVAIIRISISIDKITFLIDSLRINFYFAISFFFFISIVIAFFLSKSISKPIIEIVEFAKRLPKENFTTQMQVKGNDELSELTQSFNLMGQEIKALFQEISSDKEALNAIINAIREGLLVVNVHNKITMANKAINTIINKKITLNDNFLSHFTNENFINTINEIRLSRVNVKQELEFNNRIYRVNYAYIENDQDIVCIFIDITETKTLERTKRDFVSNVSHELRTPLTSIKGFLEILQEEELNDKKKHYLKIIERNTTRLINLVKDLLLLAEVEDTSLKLQLEIVSINQMITSVSTIFETKLKEKDILLKLESYNSNIEIIGDSFKLEQVFINLIDNAIKYSERGEINIKIEDADKDIKIKISDTGIGIPSADLERVFERFYVVDKARSKQQGGTGLGLSLVKHIILLHKGKIVVSSEKNIGTTFTITLPKKI